MGLEGDGGGALSDHWSLFPHADIFYRRFSIWVWEVGCAYGMEEAESSMEQTAAR